MKPTPEQVREALRDLSQSCRGCGGLGSYFSGPDGEQELQCQCQWALSILESALTPPPVDDAAVEEALEGIKDAAALGFHAPAELAAAENRGFREAAEWVLKTTRGPGAASCHADMLREERRRVGKALRAEADRREGK